MTPVNPGGRRALRPFPEREVTVGGGDGGGQLGWIHFGLGGAEAAQVRVQWPDRETGPWIDAKSIVTKVFEALGREQIAIKRA